MPLTIVHFSIALNIVLVALLVYLLSRNKVDNYSHILQNQERGERLLKEEVARAKDESAMNAKHLREELTNSLYALNNSLLNRLNENTQTQLNQLQALLQNNDNRLKSLQEDNSKQLEQIRLTVGEKLQATLETRLGQSFKIVSERLEAVHKGLGEMQALAANVGDLKRIMSNVKTRGIWGEIQLARLLEQIFTVEQYEKNIPTRPGSNDRVEFAIKLPGTEENGPVLLPIDSKFPQEDYQRLLNAQEEGNRELAEACAKSLENRIKEEAKTICNKYLETPYTTDFAILFLPIEGIYGEVLRRPGLYDGLIRDFRIVICGPSTLSAFLNSLQLGFRTLTIQKRSSEVWALLGAVKTEFGVFGGLLEKTNKKLQETSNVIDQAARRSRAIERKLKEVQNLPKEEAAKTLSLEDDPEFNNPFPLA